MKLRHPPADRVRTLGDERFQTVAPAVTQRPDSSRIRPLARNRARHLLRFTLQMVADESVPELADPRADIADMRGRHAERIDRYIAFRIEPHRAIAQVCRADSEQPIIDHADLRMHDDRPAVSRYGVANVQSPMSIGRSQALDESVAWRMCRTPAMSYCSTDEVEASGAAALTPSLLSAVWIASAPKGLARCVTRPSR